MLLHPFEDVSLEISHKAEHWDTNVRETSARTSEPGPETVVVAIEEAVQNPGENCGVVFLLICGLTGADDAKQQTKFDSKPIINSKVWL